jgi:hypothetical protein
VGNAQGLSASITRGLITLFVLTQTPLMAIGIVALLLVPALSIWAGVTALLTGRPPNRIPSVPRPPT